MDSDDVIDASAGELVEGGKLRLPNQVVEEAEKEVLPSGTLAIRRYWGKFPAGQFICPLTIGFPCDTDSAVFASIGESKVPGSVTAGTLVGGATLTIDNVGTPSTGQLDVGITVDWGSPIAVQINYLIVPRP